MPISLSSPITGAAVSPLASPTYTLTADQNPAVNAKQWAVTALGGTQTGAFSHSVSSPFTIAFWRPLVLKILQPLNQVTGLLTGSVPVNTYKAITRKGVIPLANQAPRVMSISTLLDIPAGSESYDPVNVKAAISAHIGALSQISSSIGDAATTGLI